MAWSKRPDSFVKLMSKNSTITAYVLPCIPSFERPHEFLSFRHLSLSYLSILFYSALYSSKFLILFFRILPFCLFHFSPLIIFLLLILYLNSFSLLPILYLKPFHLLLILYLKPFLSVIGILYNTHPILYLSFFPLSHQCAILFFHICPLLAFSPITLS
jgi:hypothetical protein